jgi:thymidylate kinase
VRELTTAPYITIHGPDGVGKTSAGRNVVDTLIEYGKKVVFFDDWRVGTAWSNPFSDRHLREKVKNNPEAFVALQLAKVAVDSAAITNLTESGIAVVKDRGVLDVRADLKYRGIDPASCSGPLVREPDLAIFLQVTEEARHRRLAVKEDAQSDDFQPNTPGNRLYVMTQFVEAAVSRLAPERGLSIQTDDLTLDQVVTRISTSVEEIL